MKSLLGVLLLLIAAPASTATRYATLGEWQAAVGSHQLEDFESLPAPQYLPYETDGSPTTLFLPHVDVTGTNQYEPGSVGVVRTDGNTYLRVDLYSVYDDDRVDRFDFHEPVTAFAFDLPFFDDFGCPGSGPPDPFCPTVINVNVDGESFETYGQPFFGVVLDAPISSFEITGYVEIAYHLDNLRWASVPEPDTALLLMIGMVALARRPTRSRTCSQRR